MRGSAGPWLIQEWMNKLVGTNPYAALHTGVPSPDDPTATEVTGAWYSRKAFAWDTLDDTAAANAAPVQWTAMPAVTLAGVAVYTAATGSSLMLWCPYAAPVSVKTGGSIAVATNDLYVEIV